MIDLHPHRGALIISHRAFLWHPQFWPLRIAGERFFSVSLSLRFRNVITHLLIDAVELANILRLEHNINLFSLGRFIFDNSKEYAVLPGVLFELGYIFGFDGDDLQLLVFAQKPV